MAIGFGGQSQQRWGDNTLNAQEYMRDLLLTDTKGQLRATGMARRGGMVLLAFVKTENAVCQTVLASLQKMQDAYGATGKLSLWAVTSEGLEKASAFAAENGITFPLLLDRENYHFMTYGLTEVPTVFLADGTGLVRKKLIGYKPKALNEMSEIVAKFAEVAAVEVAE